jgi:hypothetical protein
MRTKVVGLMRSKASRLIFLIFLSFANFMVLIVLNLFSYLYQLYIRPLSVLHCRVHTEASTNWYTLPSTYLLALNIALILCTAQRASITREHQIYLIVERPVAIHFIVTRPNPP